MIKKFTFIYVFALLSSVFFANAQDCPEANNFDLLRGNNVRAITSSSGTMFWDLSDATYEVPAGSGINAIFASSVWMGGIDDQGQLKLAANTYRQTGTDFFPGNISDETGEAICQFDKVYIVTKEEVQEFIDNGFTNPSENILNWPARNNPNLIEQGLDMNHDLAPFFDADKDGDYNPENGDYPLAKGDNNVWRVFNDAGNEHTETGGEIIGMEIQSMGYNFETDDYLNNSTFWDFKLKYKGTSQLTDFYFAFWVDADLGEFQDDFVGCNPELNTAYVYNGDELDGGTAGYGAEIPALAITFINGLKDGAGNDLGMSSFRSYNNDFAQTGNPQSAEDIYNYLAGFWLDGTPITEGGDGYGGDTPTNFMFSGSPNDPNTWSECSEGNQPADRRFLMVTGPITLEPGAINDVTLGIVWGEAENFEYPCPDVHTWVDTYHSNMLTHIENTESELEAVVSNSVVNLNQFSITPNPASEFISLESMQPLNTQYASLFNVDGKLVKNIVLDNGNKHTINIESLNDGIYFLKIYDQYRNLLGIEKIMVVD